MDEIIHFDDWYRDQHSIVLAALVMFCAGDHARAEDATNDGFVAAFEDWANVSQMEVSTGWVVRVSINSAKRRSLRRKRRIELLNSRRIESAMIDTERDFDVMTALAALPNRQRTALVLRYVEDLTQAEVAERMDIAAGTASATLTQARENLRTALNESDKS